MKPISAMQILDHHSKNILSWHSIGSNKDLVLKLFYYFYCIEAIAYEEYKDYVRWLIKDTWYSSDQIDRMIKLKVFG